MSPLVNPIEWFGTAIPTCMACSADQEYVLAVCLEHIPQASLNLILQWGHVLQSRTRESAVSLHGVQIAALQRDTRAHEIQQFLCLESYLMYVECAP